MEVLFFELKMMSPFYFYSYAADFKSFLTKFKENLLKKTPWINFSAISTKFWSGYFTRFYSLYKIKLVVSLKSI